MSSEPLAILVDADACPVKAEIYRVAERHQIKVYVVANSYLRIPVHPLFEQVTAGDKFGSVDDWIAERSSSGSIVITADIPLADRCLKAGAEVISPKGKPFTKASIGTAMADREILDQLRASGTITGGPRPMEQRDRSRFLSSLDEAIVRLKRRNIGGT